MCKELKFTVSDVLENYKKGQRFFYKTNAKDEKDKLHFIQDNSKKQVGSLYYTFDVNDCGYDETKKDYYIDAYIKVPQAIHIDVKSQIVNLETKEVLLSFKKATCFCSSSMHYTDDVITPLILSDEQRYIFYTTATLKYANATHELCIITDSNIDFEYTHTHPKKQSEYVILKPSDNLVKNNIEPSDFDDNIRGGADTINIALFREPQECSDLDYLCDFGKGSSGNPLFCVPLEGNLKLKSHNLTIESAQIYEYIVDDNGHLFINNNIEPNINNNQLKFDYKKPWDKAFILSGGWKEYIFNYEVYISMKVKNPSGSVEPVDYTITSYDDKKGKNIQNIKPISIMWGCVGEDSLILLQDKTTKKIKDITLDDMVLTSNGAKKMHNIWHGYSDKYIIIKADDKELVCSLDHPIMTEQGFKRAEKLSKTDKLLTYDNKYVNIDEIIIKDEKIMTYNLAFEDDNELTMIAQGFVVGNFRAQNTPNIL